MISTLSLNSTKWKLSEEIHGAVISFFISLELLLSLPANAFIVIHFVYCRKKSYKKSGIILMFCLALGNLLMSVFYMPFVIVASGAGEWVFGATDFSRHVFCQIHGFVHMCANTVSVFTLAAISLDRCLNIVKANIHGSFMNWRSAVAISTAIWVSNTCSKSSLHCCLNNS